MRVKVISDPSGMGTPVGSVFVIPDEEGAAMIATGRAVEWDEPDPNAGFNPRGDELPPVVELVLGENARRQAEQDNADETEEHDES